MLNFRRFLIFSIAIVVLLFSSTSVYALTSYICKNKATGAIAIRTLCLKGEIVLKNISTLTGPQGPKGDTGATGTTGATGPAGISGGTITGKYSPVPLPCHWTPGFYNNMYGTVGIVGTSYISNFSANGTFAIYHVNPGTYNLVLMSVSHTSFFSPISTPGFGTGLSSNVVVTEGHTTDVGTVSDSITCCGNNELDAGELCDIFQVGNQTCITQGFPLGGVLRCNVTCTGYDTSNCDT